jgi:formylglycine-generating enzyme required for sulfatase activity
MKRRTSVLILFFLAVSLLLSAQESERRTALVIGNANYKSSPLQNPVNDARDMAETLQELGFSVTTKLDCSAREMTEAIREFGNALVHSVVGLFYYAGHGTQIGGRNYLIPVDADIRAEDEVKFFSVDAGLVLSKMESAGNQTNIVILDACRDNPFQRSFRTESRGLAVVEAPRGSLVVYATAPGSVAAEGRGRNGVFTRSLLNHIKTPGIEVEAMLKKVRSDVLAATGGEQIPWSSSSLTGSFYFAGASGGVASVPGAERRPTVTVEKAYGSIAVEARTAGTLYLDGTQQVRIPTGGMARIGNLEAGRHSLEMRYENGERESRVVTVGKDQTSQVAFSYVERPAVPEGFVLVEAGSFQMGSTDGTEDEKPIHSVNINRSFYISRDEVTQKQWREVMGSNPSHFKGDDLPVECVSWYEAVDYCNRLSRKEGLASAYRINGEQVSWDISANGYRLPTEAEWEYAARGGNKSRGYTYAGSNVVDQVGWYHDNSGNKTHEVGQKRPNELGLYDMSGNVSEWCWDWYGEYHSSSQTDPRGPSGGSDRVYRGGSWNDSARYSYLRVADRDHLAPAREGIEVVSIHVGFRPVRTAE